MGSQCIVGVCVELENSVLPFKRGLRSCGSVELAVLGSTCTAALAKIAVNQLLNRVSNQCSSVRSFGTLPTVFLQCSYIVPTLFLHHSVLMFCAERDIQKLFPASLVEI